MKQKDFFTSSYYTVHAICNDDCEIHGWILYNGDSYLKTAKGVTRVFKTSDSVIALCNAMGAESVNFMFVEGAVE